MISVTIVVVRAASTVLLTASEDEDETVSDEDRAGGLKSDSKKDEISGCRDSKSAVLVLEDEVEDVDEAGAVELVTIWRFTCRGK